MKYYDKRFYDSMQFYGVFFCPAETLDKFYYWEGIQYGRKTDNMTIEAFKLSVENDYIVLCQKFLSRNVYFYDELSKYVFDNNGQIKPLNQNIFKRIRYYATKFLILVYEAKIFIEDEKRRFEKMQYSLPIVQLSKSSFVDCFAEFKYDEIDTLCIRFWNGCNENTYEFKGVKGWTKPEFFNNKPALMLEELYEESENQFHYNTLWYYDEGNSYNCSELCLEFNELRKIK